MGGGVEGGGGEGEGGGGGSGEGGGGEGEGGGGGEGEGGGGGGKGEGGEYWRHVVDVMVPPELQTWSPSRYLPEGQEKQPELQLESQLSQSHE